MSSTIFIFPLLGRCFGKDYDITILYDTIYEPTKEKFERYFEVIERKEDVNYICDRLLVTYSTYYYPKNILTMDENYMFIHGNMSDYEHSRRYKYDNYTKYIGVSEISAKKAEGYFPTKEIDHILNPIKLDMEEVKPHLKLVSAQRNDPIKKGERIHFISQILDEEDIPYTWNVFTDTCPYEDKVYGGVIYRRSVQNALPYIKDADYFVQLSDSEACSYSIMEALALNTKVIVTPLECYTEMGMDETQGFIIPFELFQPENKEELRKVVKEIYKNKNSLLMRIKALSVFSSLKEDPVISALSAYLQSLSETDRADSCDKYSQMVATLYGTGYTSLSLYVYFAALSCENIYVRTVGAGRRPDSFLRLACSEDLKTLQYISDMTWEETSSEISSFDFLPRYGTSELDIAGEFYMRCDNIGRYGYGKYAKNHMFCLNDDGQIIQVKSPDAIRLKELMGYERERKIVFDNTKALLEGKPAANVLLTGDAGTGKSSTIKAVANELRDEGLRMIEIRKEQLRYLPRVIDELSANPLRFIIFIDDLSFMKDDDDFNALKAALEGSVQARSRNVVIYATSNHRHIVKEKSSDRDGDDIHRNETIQEMISLSDRFGIHVSFYKPDKRTFLDIVRYLADAEGIDADDDALEAEAERFALERGGRSARLARQFIDFKLSGM